MARILSWSLGLIAMLQVCLHCVSGRWFTEEEKQALLDAHNYYRRLVVREQQASNIRLMEWNRELEEYAYNYAKRCVFAHSPQSNRLHIAGEKTAGENLWLGSYRKFNYTKLVGSWYKEIRYYDYDTLGCTDVCGHYTQVIWFKSYKLGCSITENLECPRGVLFACNYGPAGNFRYTKPFKKGPPCSGCKGEWTNSCIDGLCSKRNISRTDKDLAENGADKTIAHHVFAVFLLTIAVLF